MRVLRLFLGLLLVAGAGGLLRLPARPRDPWAFEIPIRITDANDPFTGPRLLARARRLAPLVAQVVGAPLRLGGLRVVAADPRVEAARALRTAGPPWTDPTRDEYLTAAYVLACAEATNRMLSRGARYVPERRTIQVFPAVIRQWDPPDLDAFLDVVLAHELTHVWQAQHLGARLGEGVQDTSEGELARAAAREGGAEFVARDVARRKGHPDAFEWLARQRKQVAESASGTIVEKARAGWVEWVYADGLRFVESVQHALGRERAWATMYDHVPSSVWSIEHPQAWMRRPDERIRDLDAWSRRLRWLVQAAPPRPGLPQRWGSTPLRQQDLEGRLRKIGGGSAASAWTACRGGLSVGVEPRRGPLAGAWVALWAWRFATPVDATQARRSLVHASETLGPRSWLGPVAKAIAGGPRVLAGADGTLVHTFLLFDGPACRPREASWGVRVRGPLLFEAFCVRDGVAPALRDLLDDAARARVDAAAIDAARAGAAARAGPWARLAALRHAAGSDLPDLPAAGDPAPLRDEILARLLAAAGREEQVSAWLGAGPRGEAAWTAALAPAAGHEDDDVMERGPLLEAALGQKGDVVRFALGALAEERCRPGPWSAATLVSLARLATDADAWVRTAAVRAAQALARDDEGGSEGPLDAARVEALASDPAPAVRAAVAGSGRLLGGRRDAILRRLDRDPDSHVRCAARAAQKSPPGTHESLLEHIKRIALDPGSATQRAPRDQRVDRQAALETFLDAGLSSATDGNQEALAWRVRLLLDQGDDPVRAIALLSVRGLGTERARFLPDLLRAFPRPLERWAAMTTLADGDLDLAPARAHLLRMLDQPLWRADVLRAIAAHGRDLPAVTRRRVEGWLEAPDLRVRCAAALVLLRLDPQDPRSLRVLDAAWDDLPSPWRIQALRMAWARRPGDPITLRMRARALSCEDSLERSNARDRHGEHVFDEVYLESLLHAVRHMGPVVAGECWKAFLDAARSLEGPAHDRAGELLAAHLHRWNERGRMPRIDPLSLGDAPWGGLRHCEALREELDRCLLEPGTSALRASLAILRADPKDAPAARAVREALLRVLSLQDVPDGLDRIKARRLVRLLERRDDVDAACVRSVLRWMARSAPRSYGVDLGGLLGDPPDRVRAALAVVPDLLEDGSTSSVGAALDVLEEAGPAARNLLPRLKALRPRALPSWRRKLQTRIDALE